MTEPRFIHLRVHSDFSMVDGLSKVPPLVKKVAEIGMPAVALTDFTNCVDWLSSITRRMAVGSNLS